MFSIDLTSIPSCYFGSASRSIGSSKNQYITDVLNGHFGFCNHTLNSEVFPPVCFKVVDFITIKIHDVL